MKKKYLISLLLIVFVAVGLIFAKNFMNSPDFKRISASINGITSSDYVRVVKIRSGEDMLEPEIIAPISKYFETTYAATADLKTTDITTLFLDPSSENAWINQNTLDYLINLRLAQTDDLRMTNYECGLKISEINDTGDELEVVVMEDRTVNFAFIPNIDSSSSGIKHTFYLKKDDNGYVIVEHHQEEDYFSMIEKTITDNSGNLKEAPAALLNQATSVVKDLSLDKKAYNVSEQKTRESNSKNPYDAKSAVSYAMTWVNSQGVIRNTDEYGIYDQYDGNCNNYISQCLHAGGIPMDYFGDAYTQWKWYDDSINLEETDSGRSPAWAGVDEFYTYANENTGYGLAAIVDDNVFSGSIGDILQYGYNQEWHHSVIITDVITDENGNMLDYLINSNTTDRINYPASAYGYPEIRLIKIMGWNDNPTDPNAGSENDPNTLQNP
ncbi:amidase domain-containing protein [Acetobacterium paludosum]|nr:amidase domain-containing protein [Acetobacterium paludosum]